VAVLGETSLQDVERKKEEVLLQREYHREKGPTMRDVGIKGFSEIQFRTRGVAIFLYERERWGEIKRSSLGGCKKFPQECRNRKKKGRSAL